MASGLSLTRRGLGRVLRTAERGEFSRLVPPAHTFTVGHWKYRERYGGSIHEAAARVIARRAMGFREQIPRALRRRVVEWRRNSARQVHPHGSRERNRDDPEDQGRLEAAGRAPALAAQRACPVAAARAAKYLAGLQAAGPGTLATPFGR
ncbi:hypothetical protein caldi_24110 [Caldinitratiruptor microaerophilus]|uniref:Uncharacterized protein n=1 Tax=Caldinitratiruptor microaerophilus TaxID=671077 RepID=A0AA35G6H7_9FIRM|nr:hypothetical protein caldi_24110 [Caldinitratiruptor microaerophilus]